MTLLITAFAAVIATIVWYKDKQNNMKLGSLALMYWGAAIMWFVDAFVEYRELGAEYFTPEPVDMLNDMYLGLSVAALGLIIWLVLLLIKDPNGKIKHMLTKSN